MNELSKFLARFQYQNRNKALKAKGQVIQLCSAKSCLVDKKTFALKISRHQRTRFLASQSVSHGAIDCNSRVMSEIFLRVV
jgi:hypothetical protein